MTDLLLQAEPALADLAEQFEQWRRTRATAQERIPPRLWDQAGVLTRMLPCSQVAKRLRLSPTDLKKQCLARQGSLVAEAASPHPGFIEVTPAGFETPAAPQAAVIEVERPDGIRLRLQYPDAPPLATVLRTFLEVAPCCSYPRRVGFLSRWPRSISVKELMGWRRYAGAASARIRWMEQFTSSVIARARP